MWLKVHVVGGQSRIQMYQGVGLKNVYYVIILQSLQ